MAWGGPRRPSFAGPSQGRTLAAARPSQGRTSPSREGGAASDVGGGGKPGEQRLPVWREAQNTSNHVMDGKHRVLHSLGSKKGNQALFY